MKLLRSEEHTSELQSRGLISYAVFCLKKKKTAKHYSLVRSLSPPCARRRPTARVGPSTLQCCSGDYCCTTSFTLSFFCFFFLMKGAPPEIPLFPPPPPLPT